jgi:hypothetical protein
VKMCVSFPRKYRPPPFEISIEEVSDLDQKNKNFRKFLQSRAGSEIRHRDFDCFERRFEFHTRRSTERAAASLIFVLRQGAKEQAGAQYVGKPGD